jgi:diketogulonate reductase-like aldo/keto reductase
MVLLQNEAEVGQGIKESGVKREDIYITSKVRYNTSLIQLIDQERFTDM